MQLAPDAPYRPFSFWRAGSWLVFSYFIFFMGFSGWGQAPNYTHDALNSGNLDDFSLNITDALNPQAKLNRLIIAVDVNTEGERFVLTFGNGIKRVGDTGGLINFIPNQSERLSNPLDFAINSEGKFFVATNESNRRFIRVYSPTGVYLPNETLGDGTYGDGSNQFRGPTGLAFDKYDNLYVADHYIGDQNPTRPSFIKIYGKDVSGIYKNNLLKEFNNIQGTILNFPYRIAVNSQGHLYMAEVGQDNNAKVKILQFDADFNPTQIGELSDIPGQTGSAGSIIIDKFDNIFVADLGNDLDLSRVLEATNDLDEFYEVFEIIKRGIQNNLFNIKVYNPNNSFNKTISSEIDLPVDLAISNCGRLYVNNTIFDGKINRVCLPFTNICERIPDITIDFDLEVYQRSPGYDTEKPVLVVCPPDKTESLTNGKFILLDYGADSKFEDNCDNELTLSQSPSPGVEISETTEITITATDADGNISESCSFSIIIEEDEENSPPVSDPDFYSVWEDNILEVDVLDGVLQNDSDPEGDELIAVLDRTTLFGVLDLRPDGSFTYTPNLDFFGTDTFTYFANDGQGNSVSAGIVEITIKPVPDIDCESSFTLQLDADGIAFLEKEDLYEVDQGNVQFSLNKENFTCEDLGENTVTLSYTYTIPDEGEFAGSCDIQIIIEDNIVPVIVCPEDINESTAFGEEGKIVTYNSPVFEDNCSGSSIEQTAGLISGSEFPLGSTINTFLVTDSAGNTSTCSFSITVTEEEQPEPPVFNDCPSNIAINTDPGVCGATVNFSTPTASTSDGPVEVIITSGLGPGDFFSVGQTTVIFEATSDEGIKIECSFTVTVIDIEDPVINCPDPITVNVDPGETSKVVNFQAPSGSDNCSVNVAQTEGFSSGSPFPIGTTRITFTATDANGNFSSCSFNVIVNPETIPSNSAPVANTDSYPANQDTTLNVTASDGVLENDTDLDGDTLTATVIATTTNGVLTLASDGSFNYAPNPGYFGPDSFTYFANDGTDDSNTATVNITVNAAPPPSNSAPVANTDSYTLDQDTTLNVTAANGVLDNDTDLDGDTLTATVLTSTTNGVLTLASDGSFTYIPNPGYFGPDSFTYVANDRIVDSNIATVTIIVIGSSSNDFLCKDELTLQLDQTGNVTLSASDLYTGDPGDREFTLSKAGFDCTNTGENQVVLNYTGSNGSGSCNVNVRIEDNLSPDIRTQNINISLDFFGFASITAAMLDNGTSDNCGVPELSLDILDFSCKNLGENTVLFTAKDASGNSATQTVIVNISGNCEEQPVSPVKYIYIYPNPTQGAFTFETPSGWIIEKVDVFDYRGRYITTATFPLGEPYNMDLTSLQTAVYTLHLSTNKGNKIIRVIIR